MATNTPAGRTAARAWLAMAMAAVALGIAAMIDEDLQLLSGRAVALVVALPLAAVMLALGFGRWRWWRAIGRTDRELLIWSLLFLVGLGLILLPGDQALGGLMDLVHLVW